MFGETRVDPDVLFAPADQATPGPPPDTIDIQFRVPLSFSAFVEDLVRSGRRAELAEVQAAYEQVVALAATELQLTCGYVDHPRYGPRVPARLALAVSVEPQVPGIDGYRPHGHIYVGATATTLRDGSPAPVAMGRLRRGVDNVVWTSYQRDLWSATSDRFGLTWDRPSPGAMDEVVDPPYAAHIGGMVHGVCPGRWGPRTLVLADEQYLRECVESTARLDAERGRGRALSYMPRS